MSSSSARRTRTVTVELPDEAFAHHPWDAGQVAADLRVLWLVELVRQRRLGHGKAAELAGMTRWEFIREMGRHGVSPFDFDEDDLRKELEGS
jgi:predicted HTH domain antitoxin